MAEEKLTINEEEQAQNTKEETKQNMAKVFGINLKDIEEVILPDGREFFKFLNPEDKTIRMIENRRDHKNLSEQFKTMQETLAFTQSENEKQNAKALFDYQLKYQNVELQLIPIRDLKGNKSAYKHLFDALDPEKKKAVRVLIENMDYLELAYINVENAIGIDNEGNVITASYNVAKGKCELASAEVRNYETNKVSIDDDDGYTFDVSDAEFDAVIDSIDVSDDTPFITEEQEIDGKEQKSSPTPMIRGHAINLTFAIQAYQYPEIIERSELSTVDKMIYRGLIAAMHRKQQKAMSKKNNKQYVLKPNKPNQAAFVDSILIALLLGFFSGLLLTLMYLSIKAGL